MTTEEKLQKTIDFIKKIEKMELSAIEIGDLIHISDGNCEECGSNDVYCDIDGVDINVVDTKEIEKLKHEAWHLLVDIDGL